MSEARSAVAWRRRPRTERRAPGASLVRPAGAALAFTLALAGQLVLSTALAHATLVLGTASFGALPPASGTGTELRVQLHDPSLVEVEDAIVFVELSPVGWSGPTPLVSTDRLAETEPGVYLTALPALGAGEYQMRVVDRTFRQEEAIAEVVVTLDDGASGTVAFVLPPTATSQQDLLSWLVWVIGLPLLAGVIVTVLVLRSGARSGAEGTGPGTEPSDSGAGRNGDG